jgi:hypothetical protein
LLLLRTKKHAAETVQLIIGGEDGKGKGNIPEGLVAATVVKAVGEVRFRGLG